LQSAHKSSPQSSQCIVAFSSSQFSHMVDEPPAPAPAVVALGVDGVDIDRLWLPNPARESSPRLPPNIRGVALAARVCPALPRNDPRGCIPPGDGVIEPLGTRLCMPAEEITLRRGVTGREPNERCVVI
jgi:hypothetical protein